MSEADDILKRIYLRIADRGKWHGNADTRHGDFGTGGGLDVNGEQVPAVDPRAVRHCVIGMLKLETGAGEGVWPVPGAGTEAFQRIGEAAGWEPGQCHNDRDGYEAVRSAVLRALVKP